MAVDIFSGRALPMFFLTPEVSLHRKMQEANVGRIGGQTTSPLVPLNRSQPRSKRMGHAPFRKILKWRIPNN